MYLLYIVIFSSKVNNEVCYMLWLSDNSLTCNAIVFDFSLVLMVLFFWLYGLFLIISSNASSFQRCFLANVSLFHCSTVSF